MELLNDLVFNHWPFFAAAVIFGFVGEAMKRLVTKAASEKNRAAWWFRATMPLHPVGAGVLVGASGRLPVTLESLGDGGGVLYYGLAGVVSSYAYAAFKSFLEKRTAKKAPESVRRKIVPTIDSEPQVFTKEVEEEAQETPKKGEGD